MMHSRELLLRRVYDMVDVAPGRCRYISVVSVMSTEGVVDVVVKVNARSGGCEPQISLLRTNVIWVGISEPIWGFLAMYTLGEIP
jgi:hypothetical protein